jgi:hypothetical protein
VTTPTTYVRHTKKTEWGLGMLVDNDATYFRYFFEDGELRSFSSASLSFLAEASASAAEIEALQGLKTSRKRALGADKKKKKTISEELRGGPDSTRKVAAAAPVISTLKQQLERFSSHFPKGFEDEKYIDQERGGHGSRKIGRQGVVDLARESLASAALRDNVMLKLKGIGTANLYKKLIHKGKTLFANEEIDSFSLFAKTPPNEQRLCEALVDMLHGQGPRRPPPGGPHHRPPRGPPHLAPLLLPRRLLPPRDPPLRGPGGHLPPGPHRRDPRLLPEHRLRGHLRAAPRHGPQALRGAPRRRPQAPGPHRRPPLHGPYPPG